MKKIFLLYVLLGTISITAFSQQYSVVNKYGELIDSVEESGDVYDYVDLKLYVKNILSTTLDSMRMKYVSLVKPDEWTIQLCEGVAGGGQCYDLSLLANNWDLPLSNIPSTDSNELKGTFVCWGVEGTGTLRIFVYHQSNTSTGDTLTFIYNATDMSGVEEYENNSFKVSPIITSGLIKIEMNAGLENPKVEIFNVLGQNIKEFEALMSNDLYVNTRSWNKGSYFIRVTENGKPVGTKKVYVTR